MKVYLLILISFILACGGTVGKAGGEVFEYFGGEEVVIEVLDCQRVRCSEDIHHVSDFINGVDCNWSCASYRGGLRQVTATIPIDAHGCWWEDAMNIYTDPCLEN